MNQKKRIQDRLLLIDRARNLVSECKELSSIFFKAQTIDEQKQIMYAYIQKREDLQQVYKTIGDLKANEDGRANL